MNMTRREAVVRMALLMGATTLVGPRLLARNSGAAPGAAPSFTPADQALLDEIADTIMPPTKVPGAKAAGVGAFIVMMLQDCYEAADQALVRTGLVQLNADYAAKYQGAFVTGRAADRTAFLTELDRARPKYFRILKELTLVGYFTSEIGCTQALQYVEVPGRFDSDIPYRKGDRDWSEPII